MTKQKYFLLRKLKFGPCNLPALLLLFTLLSACDEYRIRDLTSKIKPTNPILPDSSIIIEVNHIRVFETYKNRNVIIDHDHMGFEINFTLQNNSDSTFYAVIERLNSQIKGVFNYRGTRDTLHFITSAYRDTLTVSSNSTISNSLGTDIYFFEDLFDEKQDYTNDMVELINSVKLFYQGHKSIVPILFSDNLKSCARSTRY